MNIQISITDNITPDILVFHYQLCQVSLKNIIGFIEESEWEEKTKTLKAEQKEELENLWVYIKTNNRQKPAFYSIEENETFAPLTQLKPVKIKNNGYYCPSLVYQAHESYCITNNPALEQINNLNSLTKILKSSKKKQNKNQNSSQQNNIKTTTKEKSQKPTGYLALKQNALRQNKKQTNHNTGNTKPVEHSEFNIWKQGVDKIKEHGKSEHSAKSFIAKHIKIFNEDIVLNALKKLPSPEEKHIMDIYGFLVPIMRSEEEQGQEEQKARNRRAKLVL